MAETEKHVIDTYGPPEFFTEVIKEFGPAQSVALVGWMILFGATGGDNRADMVARLVGAGFSKSSVYRAAADIQRLIVHLYENRGRGDELPNFPDAVVHVANVAHKVDLSKGPRPMLNY
jgi:hypothetical protein